MKQILVAGGCGFIGSHLCERLLKEGHRVFCLDNAVTGSWDNVREFKEDPNFKILERDVSKPIDFPGELDEVYHLASPASPKDFETLSIEILRANAYGADHLLQLCEEKKARFLFASTSEVYGDPEVHPQSETYWGRVNPIGPRSPYDESKRFGEAFTVAFCKQHSIPFAIARIFNTYGPKMAHDDGRVVSNLVCDALGGKPLRVYGDGKQTRSFCYVTDLVDGLMRCMEGAHGQPINIGSSDEVTILELAQTIARMTGNQSKVGFRELPQDDPKVRRPDTSRAKKLLGWQTTVDLKSGLKQCIEFYRRIFP